MSVDSFEASVKKSDALKEDLFEHPTKYVMLTGDRPTGRLHLGHYFGTIKERVNLQNKGVPTRVVIADYQVITDRDTTEHIQDNVYNMVMDYLARQCSACWQGSASSYRDHASDRASFQ